MSKTLTLTAFAEAVAKAGGYTNEFCESFITGIFKTVEDGLKQAGKVKIKGLGEFVKSEAGEVCFIPEQTVADRINEPFAFFEPEVLEDEFIEYPQQHVSDDSAVEEESVIAESVDIMQTEGISDETEPQAEATAISETTTGMNSADIAVETLETEMAEQTSEQESAPEDAVQQYYGSCRRQSVAVPFLGGIALGILIGLALGYFSPLMRQWTPESPNKENIATDSIPAVTINRQPICKNDSAASVQSGAEHTLASENCDNAVDEQGVSEAPVVTDIVKTTLAALSRKHFGSYEFWVYIYDANRDKIDNPDRVEPGIEVVIPSAEKYGIDRNDRQSIKEALRHASEIYAEKGKS